MADIFLSYQSDRSRAAAHLADALQAHGYSVWWDYKLVAGEKFDAAIDRELQQAKAVVVLWCSRSIRSGWVQREAEMAKQSRSYLPVVIEPLPSTSLPAEFQFDHMIDLSGWNGAPVDRALVEFIESVANLVGRRPMVDWEQRRELESVWERYGKVPLRGLLTTFDGTESGLPYDKRLAVGFLSHPPLMQLLDQDAQEMNQDNYAGPWVDLFRMVASQLDLDYKIETMTAEQLLVDGIAPVDIVLGLFKTDRRAKTYDFSVPIYRVGLQGVTRAEAPRVTKEQLARGDLKVVVQAGEVGWEYALTELPTLQRKNRLYVSHPFATFETMELLWSPENYVSITDELSCLHFLNRTPRNSFRLAFDRPLQMFDQCFAVRKGLAFSMDRLNQALIDARNSQPFLRIEDSALAEIGHAVERCSLR